MKTFKFIDYRRPVQVACLTRNLEILPSVNKFDLITFNWFLWTVKQAKQTAATDTLWNSFRSFSLDENRAEEVHLENLTL